MKPSIRTCLVGAFALVGVCGEAQATYFGNSLTVTNGGADGEPPLVILGEYNPAGPSASSGISFPTAGTVTDVQFYGASYNFTLYALSPGTPGPGSNEQTFSVVAEESFSGSATSPSVQTLVASGFSVGAGDLLAFAGTGPYYSQNANDAIGSDATYENATYPDTFTATAPAGVGSTFTVGLNTDLSTTYEYIPDNFNVRTNLFILAY